MSLSLVRSVADNDAPPLYDGINCIIAETRDYDRQRYEARNLVERFFNMLKHFRRIATRYEKLDLNFLAMVTCGCIMLWLK